MRDYQPAKSPYVLPHNLWRQTLYIIRDYQRMVEELNDMLEESPAPPDGQPKSGKPGDPVAAMAARREKYKDRVRAIEKAKAIVPVEYREGVWRNIIYGSPYPLDAGRATYTRWKSRYVYMVAELLCLI